MESYRSFILFVSAFQLRVETIRICSGFALLRSVIRLNKKKIKK